jgi:hypothetical protein
MYSSIFELERVAFALLIVLSLLLVGSSTGNAQGRGRGGGIGPSRGVAMPMPAPRVERGGKLMPPPSRAERSEGRTFRHERPERVARTMRSARSGRLARNERHRARKLCTKDCKAAHHQAILACRDRIGADRAACERAANHAHRNCMHSCR